MQPSHKKIEKIDQQLQNQRLRGRPLKEADFEVVDLYFLSFCELVA